MDFRDIVPFRRAARSDVSPLFNTMQQQVNRLFDQVFKEWDDAPSFSVGNGFPFLNVSETNTEVTIKAELPGLEEKDVTLEVTKNQLTIKGEKKSETEEKDKEGMYWMKEISYGNFSRTLSLPFEIDTDKTKASFSKGVLTLTIQKPTESISQTKVIPLSQGG